jgi:hypothetical protein
MKTRFQTSRRAVALIVTLIMLSVVTFLAVAFLTISRRERTSVIVQGSAYDAYHLAVTGYNRALAEVVAKMLATGDKANYGLIVSTNFINFAQLSPIPVNNYTSVNYSAVLNQNDLLATIGNLFYNPRPPVVLFDPVTGLPDFRFYLDFNRNGRHESNGVLPELNDVGTTNGLGTFRYFVGDPEWIGLLLYPGLPHSATNLFVGRFAFLVMPASKSLDLNFIHNKAARLFPQVAPGANTYFRRNQGVGSWEINLAGFFADLNTNMWKVAAPAYQYDPLGPTARGSAFTDARDLLIYRYRPPRAWENLNSPNGSYGAAGSVACLNAGFDFFSDGPFMIGSSVSPISEPVGKDLANGWPGADNTNTSGPDPARVFLDVQELLTRTNMPVASLFLQYGTSNSTRDRYTFYTTMEQLGVDSSVPRGKVNINWTNALTGAPETATGYVDWTPTNFFLVAAHQMLRSGLVTQFVTVPVPGTNYYYGTNLLSTNFSPLLSSTNIAIWPYSEYFPEVHRNLQLAVNIYDSTTNQTQGAANSYPFLPSVLRPTFNTAIVNGITNIHVAGWVSETNTVWLSYTNLDLSNSNHVDAIVTNGTYTLGASTYSFRTESLVNGQPILIGAKKGFPNFNEFVMQTIVQATRKLEMVKSNAVDVRPWQTNQMFILGISNLFGVECWNPWQASYPRRLGLMVTNVFTYVMTNEFGLVLSNTTVISSNKTLAANAWTNIGGPAQFQLPLFNTSVLLTNSAYSSNYPSMFPPTNAGGFVTVTSNSFDRGAGFPVPPLVLNITNHLRYALVDLDAVPPRVVDYVNLTNLNGSIDIMRSLGTTTGPWETNYVYQAGDVVITNGFYYTSIRPSTNIPPIGSPLSVGYWQVLTRPSTNINAGSFWDNFRGIGLQTNNQVPTRGITNQIYVGMNSNLATVANWRQWSSDTPIVREIQRFAYFMNTTATNFGSLTNRLGPLQARMQCPFSPTRKIVQNLSWEVNDPFVHYTTRDITPATRTNLQRELNYIVPPSAAVLPPMSFGLTNNSYRPWGGNPQSSVQDGTEFALWLKDPGVRRADDWDFPQAKFPNIGWLGRVHRGTPWQTVYMKSTVVNLTNWTQWARSGDTHPTNDWKLFDLFSTWPNNNAARGLLSINQTNIAAWSAVLSGVAVLSNNVGPAPGPFIPPTSSSHFINPSTVDTNVLFIFNGIQARRRAMTNFTRLGDILSVPELTTISPYLYLYNGDNNRSYAGMTNIRPLLINSMTPEQKFSVTDQMYERIPQQVLGLLTVEDSPRFVVYAWGQSLRPANRSQVTAPGPFFGMVTNYQIAAEYALRAVVRVENLPTLGFPPPTGGPRVIVESFRQLPNE